jgi:hypothetical protein
MILKQPLYGQVIYTRKLRGSVQVHSSQFEVHSTRFPFQLHARSLSRAARLSLLCVGAGCWVSSLRSMCLADTGSNSDIRHSDVGYTKELVGHLRWEEEGKFFKYSLLYLYRYSNFALLNIMSWVEKRA